MIGCYVWGLAAVGQLLTCDDLWLLLPLPVLSEDTAVPTEFCEPLCSNDNSSNDVLLILSNSLLFLSEEEAWDLLDFLRPDCLVKRGLFMSSLDLDLYKNLSLISCLILVTQFCLQSKLPALRMILVSDMVGTDPVHKANLHW